MEWKDKIGTFKQIDVRGIQGNFFQGLKKQAMASDGLLPPGRFIMSADALTVGCKRNEREAGNGGAQGKAPDQCR